MANSPVEAELTHDSLVASISQVLIDARIPNLLWGNYLLTVYGVPTIVDDVAFVLADEHIAMAESAVKEANFVPCTKGLNCPRVNGFQAQPPPKHLHINEEFVIPLHEKSDVLWKFGEFGFSQFENNPDILSASDLRLLSAVPGRGRGRFPQEFSFVRIPSAAVFCEALILLLCRDYDSSYETYWLAILSYILEYVDETDIFNGNDLGEEYRKFYYALKGGDPMVWSYLDELRSDLNSKDQLPKNKSTSVTDLLWTTKGEQSHI
ncbi:hypothetical protein N7468_005741 [Penicillium chermesinum]|uniref:Thioredoxin reductase n=1 Tax=Penicillium chermesinum TaxID=63820 RepID=A0A9W9P0E5_9EURO|nr:uncharacterized protein N7468_005741 [Penicillium chermesinum]KAJ5232785.1 hypothetical protein N7468_005741 [Penicillium chermesinum]